MAWNVVARWIAGLVVLMIGFGAGLQWEKHEQRTDPNVVEPYGIAFSRLYLGDSVSPPQHSTAMCSDGWYTFTHDSREMCRGHGGVLLPRVGSVMSPEDFHAWQRARDSLAEIALVGYAAYRRHASDKR